MENPSELIRKARMSAHPKRMPERADVSPQRPISRHGTYTDLMRKHDRVRTQHLGGQGNVRGA